MSNPTLDAASTALSALLSSSQPSNKTTKPRRKKSTKPRAAGTVDIDIADLDPAARAQREADQKRRIEEAVRALKRSAGAAKEEERVRERILEMREEKHGGKKRKARILEDEDSD
ncbi:hypothetical protein FN846DRAFT_893127 [Sphaerosporella brunnea]|uniref:Casein kinase substrate phospho protein PP28-domain-containing protein n=1 Tax=Sphaerosporella brunnea TaxID=1250544 RepID=A0A5J5ENK8_9PEZI|nr:hypothetical protein FN846DRAFT_893127 [Sphaerosporella brunnea]